VVVVGLTANIAGSKETEPTQALLPRTYHYPL